MKIASGKIKAFSFLMMALAIGAALVAGRIREKNEPFDIGDWSGIDRETAIQAYEAEQTDESLTKLLHVLCWQYKVAGDENAREPFLNYGNRLFDRAKDGACDLEKLDNDSGTLLRVISVLREEGLS